ncbi:hypothetical protein [Fodinicola feengrottensis]|uniref:hypothetical protein n=1 Tax=Fodinicola feengrottensis TaxID=435914 RepID=UPI0013D8BBE0|nr:hypothetical protein [Fodinicola feengrottensis]
MGAAAGVTGAQPLRLYVAGVAVLAGGLLALAASQAAADPVQEWPKVAVAFGLFLGCHWINVPLRFGSHRLISDWSEAALIIALALVGGGWVVLAAGLGMGLADLARRRPPIKAIVNASVLIIATTAGVSVFRLAGGVPGGPVEVGVLPLLAAAAAVSWLVNAVLIAVAIGLAQQIPPLKVFATGRPISLVVLLGNAAVSIGVLEIGKLQPWCLLAIPPVLWLVHQGHLGRTRTRVERRTWHQLAAATRALNQLDQDQVIDAAISGAAEMFAADVVEIDSAYAPPQWRLTRGDRRGSGGAARRARRAAAVRAAGGAVHAGPRRRGGRRVAAVFPQPGGPRRAGPAGAVDLRRRGGRRAGERECAPADPRARGPYPL